MRCWKIGVYLRCKVRTLIIILKDQTLIDFVTLQIGPEAARFLQTYTSFDLSELTFGKSAFVAIEGFKLHIARSGYTGEDGFEVSIFRVRV